jgi:short-subunit dehydrogenase
MESKKVIIVGASSGIGRALAILYVRAGWTVGVTGRRNELLKSLEFDLKAENGKVHTECFDVTGDENISHIRLLIEKMGGLDLLIYNSGYGEVTETMNWETDKRIIETNVTGFTEIVNWAFNYFIDRGAGHIAATSSVGSNRGTAYAPAYSASKAYMSNYMEGLYMKAYRQKLPVHITDVQPGFVNTKEAQNKRFWVIPVEKCARQIFEAIERKQFRAYVSRRWVIIARLIRYMPLSLYKRYG